MHKIMKFSGRWRSYQQRVLDEFDAHIIDERVHIVAAPGSGKTILGLELMRRLERPALVLSPTRTIRDQWPARLVPLFMAQPPEDVAISHSLEAVSQLTSSTYQGLHAIWAADGQARFEALIASLKQIGPITLILDEAHHLRREWWSALQALVDALPDARIIALTATPPYDAPFAEWARYDAMCGPIDLEIGVAELVRNGNLCPHQDHVLFSYPEEDALELLDRRRLGVSTIGLSLSQDAAFLEFLETHPWITNPLDNTEAILDAPEALSAILVHLSASQRPLPSAPLKLLGISKRDVPIPSPFWLETLLNVLLFRFPDVFPLGKERQADLKSSLHEYGLIEGGEVRLGESRKIFTLMASSIAKLESITTIARVETEALGPELRMVVLADHVRAEELTRIGKADYRPSKLGVVPIFNSLRLANITGQTIAVLTGTLIILPETAIDALQSLAVDKGLTSGGIAITALPQAQGYCQITLSGTASGQGVTLLTALLSSGVITMLIGTQALLGEGWDAPAVNTLVLASNSAAYMLSNQMRGRAIRIDPERANKVSNIWHLGTLDALPETPVEQWAQKFSWGRLNTGEAITSDLDLLVRRFRAFEGISNTGSTQIESGLGRLGFVSSETLDVCNARTLAIAKDRDAIARHWRNSLGEAPDNAHVRETASHSYAPRGLSWNDTLQWLAVSALSAGGIAGANELRTLEVGGNLSTLAMVVAGSAAIASLPKLLRASWLLLRNGSVERSLTQVGAVVVLSLNEAGIISDSECKKAAVQVRNQLSGRRDVMVLGVSRATERLVLQAMAEILGPVQNPRYLLVRKSFFGLLRRVDYHAVPTVLARKQEWAELFRKHWVAQVSSSKLVFTRTAEGRIGLLRARARSFAAGFQRRVDRRSAWT
jgi:superfamily II DNA or RNA helicase